MRMSSPRRGCGGEARFRIFGKQLAQHDQQVRRLPHRCEGKRDPNVGDDDLAHLSRAQRPQILKVERKQDAVPGGCRRAQEHFIRSEACEGCALLGRNHHRRLLHSICSRTAFLPHHGRALNCEIYVARREQLDVPCDAKSWRLARFGSALLSAAFVYHIVIGAIQWQRTRRASRRLRSCWRI